MSIVIAVVSLVVFSISAGFIWRLARAYSHLAFATTLEVSVNTEKYGHVVEHGAETTIVWLLMFSTSVARVAGGTTAVVNAAMGRRNSE